jgi:hypothetical protein
MMRGKNMKNLHIINLILGDWSHDGHGSSETFTIESNLTYKEVEKALAAGEKLVDVVLDDMAAEYEYPYVDYEDWEKLSAHGLTVKMLCDGDGYDEDWITGEVNNDIRNKEAVRLDEESFLNIFYFLVKKGNPEFQYKLIKDDSPTLKLGGYGLFTIEE